MLRVSPRALDWIVTGCGALMLLGLILVSRASTEGPIENPLVQPGAIPIYAGLLIAGYVLLASADPVQTIWRRELPPGYGIAGIGLMLIIIALIGDTLWQAVAGGQADTRALISVPNVVGFSGIGMILLAPLRAPNREARWQLAAEMPGIVALGLLLALAGGVTQFANPVTQVLARQPSTEALLSNPGEVWSMASDGSDQTRVTKASSENVGNVAWSPDGSLIAYVRMRYVPGKDRTSVESLTGDLVVATPDGTVERTIIANGGWLADPAWSPDGKTLMVNRNHLLPAGVSAGAGGQIPTRQPSGPQPNNAPAPGGQPVTAVGFEWDIALVPSDGSAKPHDLDARVSTDIQTAWSPDGASILGHSDRSGNWEIYRLDATTGVATNLTNNPAADTWADWSPDGSQVVFSSDRGGRTHLWLMNADGSDQHQLTNGDWDDWNPAWSHDGAQIALISNRDSSLEIYRVNADGTGQVNLTQSTELSEWMTRGAWSPDGKRIVYTAVAAHPPGANDLGLPLAAASIIIQSALLVALVLVARRWRRLPTGTVTIVLAISFALWTLISSEYEFIPAGVVAGLAGDLFIRWSARIDPALAGRILSFGLPALVMSGYFVALAFAGGVGWSLPLVLSGVVLAGTTGLLMSYLVPAVEAEPAAA